MLFKQTFGDLKKHLLGCRWFYNFVEMSMNVRFLSMIIIQENPKQTSKWQKDDNNTVEPLW